MFIHTVYFWLTENAPATAREQLIRDCRQILGKIPTVRHLFAGAPVGLFTHWLVWNIDPKATEIPEKGVPKGAAQGTNDYPNLGYGGPQPPSGTHRYYFKIFALDQTLGLRSGAKRQELDKAMSGHVITQGQLMGRYTHK